MDKTILEAIYEGALYAVVDVEPKDPEYFETCNKVDEEKDHFRKMLSPEEATRLDEMFKLMDSYTSMLNHAAFDYGFRLAANLIIEALTDTRDLTQNK